MAGKCFQVDCCDHCPNYETDAAGKWFCADTEKEVVGDGLSIPKWCPLPDANSKAEEPKPKPSKDQRIRAGDPGDARWQPTPGAVPVQEKLAEKAPVKAADETDVVPPGRASPRDLPKEPLEAPQSLDKLE